MINFGFKYTESEIPVELLFGKSRGQIREGYVEILAHLSMWRWDLQFGSFLEFFFFYPEFSRWNPDRPRRDKERSSEQDLKNCLIGEKSWKMVQNRM